MPQILAILYYSAEDGLAESRHVFLQGTALPDRLAKATHLTIAETGFGTGLNLLALCQAIMAQNSQCQIDYISFEAAPLAAEDVMRAHQAFPELAELSAVLIGQWPRRWHGVHRLSMLGGQVRVQLHYGQAETSLPRLSFAADIWFLDGFARRKTPCFGRHLSVMKLPAIPEKAQGWPLLALPVRCASISWRQALI